MMNDVVIGSPRKTKRRDPSNYKLNIVKEARVKGQSYVSHKGKEVSAKKPQFDCRCANKCLKNLGEEDCLDVFQRFYDIPSKNEQDLYIQGLIDAVDVQQRRPREDVVNRGKKNASFSYHLMVGVTRKEVCFKAFLSVFSISEKRVRRIRNLKLLGKTPEDKRGKGVSHALPVEIYHLVHEHIQSFPLKETHYCGKKKYYLSADLNIKKMWQMYQEKHPQVIPKVSLSFFWQYYHDNFNYPFGRPQVDVCSTCEELNIKIKSPNLNDVAKRAAVAELLVHKAKSKKFYSALQHEQSEEGKNEKHVLSLAFDYMKTISIPKLPVQELYYMRQISVNVFGIHNLKDNKTTIFLYHEGVAKKPPNEVCSFLNEYLKSVSDQYTELRLFSDNCSGQNKNQALSRLCLYLTDSGRFRKVTQYFPLRGHSFLPCDRDFGIISKALKKNDRIFTVHEITLTLRRSRGSVVMDALSICLTCEEQ
ncbi:uncharacterized protein LOC124370417 [Homalodisca vitripennis]|uniref:uncharacterized protein LOC124370417 n=1 Tax=Homalodisca vitripennis TaxID=197043 RepID=UPI001EEAACD7|nr:uncharacterized protein LOC124370417 [Homalodisca vitripennis]